MRKSPNEYLVSLNQYRVFCSIFYQNGNNLKRKLPILPSNPIEGVRDVGSKARIFLQRAKSLTLFVLTFLVHSGIGEGHNVPSDIKTPVKTQIFVQIKQNKSREVE